MSETIDLILKRRSVRAFEPQQINPEVKIELLQATLRAPTAGNLMLYTIIDIQAQEAKETLVKSCDNQPFIARAPIVWLFLADYQRWYDYFLQGEVTAIVPGPVQKPREADLMLACCDALIAAQTAVITAEALGLGSCYIGDIMENYEVHRDLFHLPRYVFPICLLCFGYPTEQQRQRTLTRRFDDKYVVFRDHYHQLQPDEFQAMFQHEEAAMFRDGLRPDGVQNVAQAIYKRKYTAAFTNEMRRSVTAMLANWRED